MQIVSLSPSEEGTILVLHVLKNSVSEGAQKPTATPPTPRPINNLEVMKGRKSAEGAPQLIT